MQEGRDDVERVPKGHCWLESDLGIAGGAPGGRQLGSVPLAMLEARVPFVVWPPQRAGPMARRVPPGRVLMRAADFSYTDS